jgi:hypothetical protein
MQFPLSRIVRVIELASTIAISHRFLPGFIARQKKRQQNFEFKRWY